MLREVGKKRLDLLRDFLNPYRRAASLSREKDEIYFLIREEGGELCLLPKNGADECDNLANRADARKTYHAKPFLAFF